MPSESHAVPPPEVEGAAVQPATGRSRKPLLIVAVIVVVAIVVGVYLHYRNRESTDDAQIVAHIESVAPRVTGTVVEVDVNDNQLVHAGQVLYRLDPRPYEDAVHQAQANLAAAQAQAQGATSGVPITTASSRGTLSGAHAGLQEAQAGETLAERQLSAAQANVRAAQAQVNEAQATASNAQANERRYAQLVSKQEVSELQYDQIATQAKAATAAEQAAQARLQASQQQVASASAQVDVARSKVAQAAAGVRSAATAPQQQAVSRSQAALAQAKVAQAQAALAEAELNLSYTTVTAPSDGEVGNKHIEIGQAFAPGQTALVIVPVNDVWVFANYKETQLKSMHPGQRAEIEVDAFGTTLNAKVNSIGAGTGSIFSLLPPENATGNYVKVVQRIPVKIVFDAGQDLSRLRPGMSVEATVFTK